MGKKADIDNFLRYFNASRVADLPADVAELVKRGDYSAAAAAMAENARLMAENARIAKEQARVRSMADLGPQTPPPAYNPNAGPRRYYPQGTGMIVSGRPRQSPQPSVTPQLSSPQVAKPASPSPAQDADGNAIRGLLFHDTPQGDAARFYARRAAEAALLSGGAYLLGRAGGVEEAPAPAGIPEDELHPQERIDMRFMEAMRNAGRR